MEAKETVRPTWHDILAFTIALYKIIVPQMLLMGAVFCLVAWLLLGVWMQ